MNENKVKEFDKFFKENYKKILNDARSITKNDLYYEDIVNENYLKIRERILRNGFNGNFYAYVWISIKNDFSTIKKTQGKRVMKDIDDYDNNSSDIEKAEQILLQQQYWNDENETYYQNIEFIVMKLFDFIETRYNEKQCYLFKTYFLLSTNYKELSEITKYSQTYISNTIKPMKKDVKNNFINYLNKK
jgi:RNA polymerase sigma factor (sigma-70 family)